jgi:hypothetical protein
MANFMPSTELAAILVGVTFPISTEELADYAREQGASEELLAQISYTPNHIFSSIDDIGLTLGLMDEFEGAESLWPAAIPGDDMLSPEESAMQVTDTESEGIIP